MNSPANDLVALLQQLIRIPSPNPPGDCRDIADFCAAYLRSAGFATTLVAPDDAVRGRRGRTGRNGLAVVALPHAHRHGAVGPECALERRSLCRHGGRWRRVFMGWAASMTRRRWRRCCWRRLTIGAQAGAREGRLVVVCAAEEEVGGGWATKWLVDNGHVPRATSSSSASRHEPRRRRTRALRGLSRGRPHLTRHGSLAPGATPSTAWRT